MSVFYFTLHPEQHQPSGSANFTWLGSNGTHNDFDNNHEPKKIILKSIISCEKMDTCVICLDDIQVGDEIHITRCNHIFHHTCLLKYLNHLTSKYYNCPLCRFKHEKMYA